MSRLWFGIVALLFITTTALAQTPLRVTVTPPDVLDGNFNATVEYAVENTGDTDLHDVRFEIEEGNKSIILTWTGPAFSCEPGPPPLTNHNLRCTAATIAAHETGHIGVVHHFLRPYVRTYIQAIATIGNTTPGAVNVSDVRFFHDFPVTTTADSGTGSLRQAIDDVNAHCVFANAYDADPCRISFARHSCSCAASPWAASGGTESTFRGAARSATATSASIPPAAPCRRTVYAE